MIASKVICDDTYSNKSWSIVAQGMFSLREINQMEREMCNYLDWELTVDNPILSNFERMVTRDFAVDSTTTTLPTYALQQVSKRAARAAASMSATPIPEPTISTSPIPSFGQRNSTPAKTDSPTNVTSYPSSPMTPETPSPSYSTSSPASSASPATPVSVEDFHHPHHHQQHSHPKKYTAKMSMGTAPMHLIPANGDVQWKSPKPLSMTRHANTSLKSRMYAFAVPVSWSSLFSLLAFFLLFSPPLFSSPYRFPSFLVRLHFVTKGWETSQAQDCIPGPLLHRHRSSTRSFAWILFSNQTSHSIYILHCITWLLNLCSHLLVPL